MAEAVAAGLELVVDAHPLVKDVALPLPAAALLRDLLEVTQDPALQVVNILKALLQQVGGALLATNPAGAEHGDRLRSLLIHQGPQGVLHPSGELAKTLGTGVDRAGEAAHLHFVAVAGVHHQGLWIGNQRIPLLRRDIGPHLLGRLHRGAAHGDDLALEPDLQAMEGLLLGAAELGLQPP